jgi:ATP-dependent Zn protease
LTWYVTDRREYLARARELGEAYRALMGRHYPAMAVVEVKALIDASQVRAREILSANRAALDALAAILIEKEVMDGAELKKVIADHAVR